MVIVDVFVEVEASSIRLLVYLFALLDILQTTMEDVLKEVLPYANPTNSC